MNTGIVNSVWTKNVTTKYGDKPVTLFSLDTNEGPFNLGFGKQAIQEGDEITFSDNGEKYGEIQVDKNTLKVSSRGNKVEAGSAPAPKAAEPAKKSGGYSRGNFPLDFTDGQRSILRQHAFTQASEIVRHTDPDANTYPDENVMMRDIISLARQIEYYTSGDELREEMQGVNDD